MPNVISDSTVTHIIVTRFNLPSAGTESLIRAQDGWLRNRVELFERYCLPSVVAQTRSDFDWIIYFDEESPTWLRERIASWTAVAPIIPLYRTTVMHQDLAADARAFAPSGSSHLLTTNLDNDDALATDFTDRIRRIPVEAAPVAIYVEAGLVRTSDELYLRRDPKNAFCSVLEDWRDPMTCWRDAHTMLHSWMPTVVLPGAPGWLQVVHGTNVSNRVRGHVVRKAPYSSLFNTLIEDVVDPTPRRRLVDTALARPGRALREAARAAGKSVVLSVAGKDGLDRIKYRLAGGRS
jgi:hypothetical protein